MLTIFQPAPGRSSASAGASREVHRSDVCEGFGVREFGLDGFEGGGGDFLEGGVGGVLFDEFRYTVSKRSNSVCNLNGG
jgi:hypothetical protein